MLFAALTVLLAAEPGLSRGRAQALLGFDAAQLPACDQGDGPAQIRCLLAAKYAGDAAAVKLAVGLYERTGTVVGVLPEQDFDGGYRGVVHLVPRLPVGALRRHLSDIALALTDFDDFFRLLGGTPSYRWRALEFRVFESVKRRTPSAYAVDWSVAYNVAGSLLTSELGVRGTLAHEIFHLNDQARGDWSKVALTTVYDRIVARCGTNVKCLGPYTPDSIKVIGGTYYDFQPGNDVREYAADIAKRYYLEHRAILRKEPRLSPFKCGPEENAQAWRLVVAEFFGGVDLVGDCPARR